MCRATDDVNQDQSGLPPVKGLVLAGGKSARMGEDKGNIRYYDVPQREHMASLLSQFCIQTFVSTSAEIDSSFKIIPDFERGLGPFGGILSAFRKDPKVAWLAVATDLPLLDEKSIGKLIEHRDPSKVATCYHNPKTGLPEPLATLWEPKAYSVLLRFYEKRNACPRKVLLSSEIEQLKVENPEVLLNVNTPEEKDKLQKKIYG